MQVGIVTQIENGQQITDKVVQVSSSGSQSGDSCLFHAPHVTTEGTDGGVTIPHGDGLATGEIATRGQALVLAGRAGIPPDSADESAAERSHLRQDHHVGVRRHATGHGVARLRIDAFAIVGIAMEIGIEPTVRQGADLGYTPVVVKDAVVSVIAMRPTVQLPAWNRGRCFAYERDTFCALLGRTHASPARTRTLS